MKQTIAYLPISSWTFKNPAIILLVRIGHAHRHHSIQSIYQGFFHLNSSTLGREALQLQETQNWMSGEIFLC